MDWWSEDGCDEILFARIEKSADSADLARAAPSAWAKFIEVVMPAHTNIAFDTVRVEVWPDTGRTIIFPALEPCSERIDVLSLDIRWEALEAAVVAVDEELDEDDPSYDSLVRTNVNKFVELLRAAAARAPWPSGVEIRYLEWGVELLAVDHVKP